MGRWWQPARVEASAVRRRPQLVAGWHAGTRHVRDHGRAGRPRPACGSTRGCVWRDRGAAQLTQWADCPRWPRARCAACIIASLAEGAAACQRRGRRGRRDVPARWRARGGCSARGRRASRQDGALDGGRGHRRGVCIQGDRCVSLAQGFCAVRARGVWAVLVRRLDLWQRRTGQLRCCERADGHGRVQPAHTRCAWLVAADPCSWRRWDGRVNV